jgi:DNA-binding transcriptional ArsR family regulator
MAEIVDRNFVTALVFIEIARINTSQIMATRQIAERHLAMGEIPADSVRQPVSAYALARDLRIPYETLRRHVMKLKAAGLCVAMADGLIVPREVFATPEAERATRNNVRDVVALVAEAGRFGVVARGQGRPASADVSLQVARLASHYFVEAMRLVAKSLELDILSALVFLTIGLHNTEKVRRDLRLATAYGGLAEIPPDDIRAPVTAYFVSRFLHLPYETARRAGLRLVELGLAERSEAGAFVIPSRVFARPGMVAAFAAFAKLTTDFLDHLADYGVVAQGELEKA